MLHFFPPTFTLEFIKFSFRSEHIRFLIPLQPISLPSTRWLCGWAGGEQGRAFLVGVPQLHVDQPSCKGRIKMGRRSLCCCLQTKLVMYLYIPQSNGELGREQAGLRDRAEKKGRKSLWDQNFPLFITRDRLMS